MPDFYLIGDESIILTSQNVVLEKELYEAILTNRRLILIRTGSEKGSSRKILLREVGSAIAGESVLGEPTITLTFTTPDGVLHAQELVFSGKDSGQDSIHYSEWVKRLKEQVRIAAQEPVPVPVAVPAPDHGGIVPVETAIPEQDKTNAIGTEAGAGADSPGTPASGSTSLIAPSNFPAPEQIAPEALAPVAKKSIYGAAIVAILIIAAIVIGGAYYVTHPRGQPSPGPGSIETTIPETLLPITTSHPTTPIQTPAETVITTTATVSPPPAGGEVIIPPTGIWVRIQYPGNFTGSVGMQGSMQEITGSGDRFFRVPATEGIIDASIQKQDNSGNTLIVTVYNNGTLVKQGNTTAPHATLNLNAWI